MLFIRVRCHNSTTSSPTRVFKNNFQSNFVFPSEIKNTHMLQILFSTLMKNFPPQISIITRTVHRRFCALENFYKRETEVCENWTLRDFCFFSGRRWSCCTTRPNLINNFKASKTWYTTYLASDTLFIPIPVTLAKKCPRGSPGKKNSKPN